ncbi:MAG TPA: hypothetical protein VIN60_09500 [Anaerolineales bacterium]
MEKSFHRNVSYELLWLSIALLPLLLIAFLLPLSPHDYWWYLRLGHDVLQLGRVPSIDTYSYTEAGESIMNQPWLSAVIFWLAYNDGGLNLTFILRVICIGMAFGFLWVWMREMRTDTRLASLLVIVAGLASSNNWAFRPQLFAYPLFSISLFVLWKWETQEKPVEVERRMTDRKKSNVHWLLWTLPLVAWLWANLHESFLLLFILEGSALIFGRGNRKQLLLVTIASFLATLITPYDIFLWISLVRSYIANSSWDISSEFLPPTNSGWQMNIFFMWVLLMVPLASLSKKRLSLLEWVWLIGMLWMALSGVRYVIWGIFMLAGFSAYLLSSWNVSWSDYPIQKGLPIVNYLIAFLILLTPFVALPGLRARMGIRTSPAISTNTPVAATVWLSQHPELPGPLWSDLTFSSYLIFALPSRSVWIDTRFGMVYTPPEFELYLTVANAQPGWQRILDQNKINLLMLSVSDEPLLIETLTSEKEWCKVYSDPVAIIYTRLQPGQSCP